MKKFKRLTALALALVMVLGLTTGAGAAGAKYSSWFAPYYKVCRSWASSRLLSPPAI